VGVQRFRQLVRDIRPPTTAKIMVTIDKRRGTKQYVGLNWLHIS
jgi:hypothetical protein